MRIATFLASLAIACILGPKRAEAQRVQFPTKLPVNSAVPPASQGHSGWSGISPVAQSTTTIAPPPSSAYPGYAPPSGSAPPGSTYAVPPGTPAPSTFAQPGTSFGPNAGYPAQPPAYPAPNYAYPPGVAPGYAPAGPTATFQGTITPPPATGWDPYATPGGQPPTLMPHDPYLPGTPGWTCPPPTNYVETMQRFLDELRVDYYWIPGNGPQELGIHHADISASFAFPFFHDIHTPLLVTPGFATTWWNGPSPPHGPGGNPEFPPRLYAAYLEAAWNPQFTPMLGAEMAARVGVYSDFDRVTGESIRYQGKGYALLALSPNMTVKAGVQYLDRQRIKLLPAGGLVWTPNPDTRFEILFPDPKLAWRLHRVGNVDWWFYGRGEYGGDSWTISVPGGVIETDYNDYRVAIGLEWDNPSFWSGYFEVGYAFEREIYQQGMVTMSPNGTIFVGAGLSY